MRYRLFLVPLAFLAAPAVAAPAPEADEIQIPRELTDAATADKLGNMVQALSKALLDLPVGELRAAAEGRPATDADRRLTVRDMGRRDDPNFELDLERQIAQSKPVIQQSMRALADALPAMTQAMSDMAAALERATANLPRPDYPRR